MYEMLLIVLGAFLGSLATLIGVLRLKVGTLRIDRHDPDKDQYRFDIDNLDILAERKMILLRVDSNAVISQE